ncbi:MAG: T9SS type A sorting domain-containing protein [Bacteroidales bacterium]|nr:T9SS type A sorting domain-containing protein [Bacteroidales bacterium]
MLNIKYILTYLFIFYFSFLLTAQINYSNGNSAYISESYNGFRQVTVGAGEMVYTYNSSKKQYLCNNFVLLPIKDDLVNGVFVDTNFFLGMGNFTEVSDDSFQWDDSFIVDNSEFDVINMFVSPVSANTMHYAKTIQVDAMSCYTDNCFVFIDSPDSLMAYPESSILAGFYNLWLGEELIDAGDIKNSGTNLFVSQQQLDTGIYNSYCVETYGSGWRIPTDLEVGHFNDLEGNTNGFDLAYMGVSSDYMWTSSLFKTYAVKRWPVQINSGYWENCAGFLYVGNRVRCVFPGTNNDFSTVKKIEKNNVEVFPNPSSGKIKLFTKGNKISEVEIVSLSGKKVFKLNGLNNLEIEIDGTNWCKGFYFLIIRTHYEGSPVIRKLVKI